MVSELDGIPLAIELAAAAAGQLSIDELVAALDDRFNVLTNGRRTAPARQQTLYAVVDWSFGLLAEPEQQLLRRLAVFSGTFSAQAVDAVAAPGRGSLDRLVSASLVVPVSSFDADAPVRYRLLETVRAFAQAQLDEAGEADAIRTAHLDWALQLATDAHAEVRGPEAPRVLQAIERDHDNLRAALAWGLAGGHPATSVDLSAKLVAFWDARGHRIEGVRWLQDALAAAGDDVEPTVKVDALIELAGISMTNDTELSKATYREAVALADATGVSEFGARARMGLGMLLGNQGHYEEAGVLLEACLVTFRELGDLHNTALSLERLSELLRDQGQEERYRALIDEAVELQRASGDRRELFWSIASLSQRAIMNGERERALRRTDRGPRADRRARLPRRRLLDQLLRRHVPPRRRRCREGRGALRPRARGGARHPGAGHHRVGRRRRRLVRQPRGRTGHGPVGAGRAERGRRHGRRAPHQVLPSHARGAVRPQPAASGSWPPGSGPAPRWPAPCWSPSPPPRTWSTWRGSTRCSPRELGNEVWAQLEEEAQATHAAGGNPVNEAFKHYETWSPSDAETVEGPPVWRPW